MRRASFLRLIGPLVLLVMAGSPVLADDFGQRISGQHVYDRANVLSASQMQQLEGRAVALETSGAQNVVLVRVKAASQEQAQQEAGSLMDAWNVQSTPAAHDGFVMLIDLDPADTRHGQVGLFAGAKYTTAQLPPTELNRIAGTVMRPALVQGDLAGGIAAGLDATAGDVSRAAPATEAVPEYLRYLPWLIALPFIGVPLFFVMVVILIVVARARGGRGRTSRSGSGWWDTSYTSSSIGSSSSDSGSASSGGDSGGASF